MLPIATTCADLREAVAGEVSVSQMVPSAAAAGLPVVGTATPYDGVAGRRVFSGAFPPGDTPPGAYFSSAVPISGGGGFLIGRAGNVLANAHETTVLPTGVEAGTEGITHLETDEGALTAATSPVTGAPWTVVLTAPSDSLYGPVRDEWWAPWAMLTAAVEAMASSVRLESPITVSIGVSSLRNGHGVIDLFRDADSAMYRAKAGGRNAVEVAGPTHRSSDQRVRV